MSFAEKLVDLRVVGSSIALKYLELNDCYYLKRVEISDTNLVSFIHAEIAIDLLLSNVPSLVELAITTRFLCLHCFHETCLYPTCMLSLSARDSHDQYSRFAFLFYQEYNKDYTFPILPNLKHLELTVEGDYNLSLSQLSYFMKAYPYLQRLALKEKSDKA
ncbi:hypothetical protein Pyn_26279 [Prunus yedoensis var. nudiflora]|uniref:F-box/FBD/LRR-repeat protein n=1 Tax=Prunus yedoensis var. nudiflora TaxID=2094558 RepID=A0A314Y808_PRUYE|nr:hypothetical protein Pyn_26279 [Prunus yedoensis var. nudiflora]